MIAITGGALVLPERVVDEGTIVISGDRISTIEARKIDPPAQAIHVDGTHALVVPGFIDVHVHGVEGVDVLDGAGSVAEVASRLPKYGVTAFCPTSVACSPQALDTMLAEVSHVDLSRNVCAKVLPAHLESNFINPEYKGAQPLQCIRTVMAHADGEFSGHDILVVMAARRQQIAIVTVAPEIEGGLDLVAQLAAAGHHVSIGHTGASYEQTIDAITAGVSHATHLCNRMTPMTHRAPGVAGAVLHSEAVVAELICDGFHVHPALLRLAIRAKGVGGVMAITDGTAGSGLAVGSRTRLGGRPIVVTERTAELEDGTLAGSVLTMDAAFRVLVDKVGMSVVEAARLCSTTPAQQLRLRDVGQLVVGNLADVTILERDTLRVRATVIDGKLWRPSNGGNTAALASV
jgi:N-acetylglucosamine-6-phosphate deacetylase